MELSELIAFLEETPEEVRRLSAGVGDEGLRERADDGSFSFVEHVCHLRDIEREGYAARIGKILTEDSPTLADVNGRRLAAERRYNEQRFEDGLGEFAEARARNVSALRGLSEEQLRRRGVFEGVGEVTLARLVSMMYEHDASHRGELGALRGHLTARRSERT
jgi:uncharacterized damage-inducible protein DinB